MGLHIELPKSEPVIVIEPLNAKFGETEVTLGVPVDWYIKVEPVVV